jgi:hypothetical protein
LREMFRQRSPLLSTVLLCVSATTFAVMAQARSASVPKILKYVGCCIAAVGGAALVRARLRANSAARARQARTLKLSKGCLECEPHQISIFSMNILSPNLVTKQRYAYCPSKWLGWDYRLRKLTFILETVRSEQACGQNETFRIVKLALPSTRLACPCIFKRLPRGLGSCTQRRRGVRE